nr:putative 6-phosphofructo-2-kinase/fructose-2,6-bisphosphatase [Quercus suber]
MDTLLTADLAANAPNLRRRSSTYVDAIHDLPEKESMAPAQLYSTESGRLFHSGRIVIATVSDCSPRMQTTEADLMQAIIAVLTSVLKGDVPDDYFFPNGATSTVLLRNKILKKCRDDIFRFLNHENGQIAIYDAVNPLASGRRALAKEFEKQNVQTLFIESHCTDERIIEENVRSVKISSPDYVQWKSEDAVKDYLKRINARIPYYETMEEPELHYVKMINAGQRVVVNNCSFGYLSQRIVFYLLNLHIKSRQTYFCRAGTTKDEDSYKADASLSAEGEDYARKMSETLLKHRDSELKAQINHVASDTTELKPLTVWTSTRRRTVETSSHLEDQGYRVRHRSQMSQLNPGVCEKMSERKIRETFPEEVAKHEQDPYHHRYPRAESYHDLAVRLEPIILELEREQNDLLIIAHESVLRVLYGYLMACSATDIPSLEFPRDEIIEIIPASYNNRAKRIHIDGLPKYLIPDSPEGLSMPIPPTGTVTPLSGLASPASGDGTRTPENAEGEKVDETVKSIYILSTFASASSAELRFAPDLDSINTAWTEAIDAARRPLTSSLHGTLPLPCLDRFPESNQKGKLALWSNNQSSYPTSSCSSEKITDPAWHVSWYIEITLRRMLSLAVGRRNTRRVLGSLAKRSCKTIVADT